MVFEIFGGFETKWVEATQGLSWVVDEDAGLTGGVGDEGLRFRRCHEVEDEVASG